MSAGAMSEAAAHAERHYEAGRWLEAATSLSRVVDAETGDDIGSRQVAEYRLAIALYRLQFFQASYDIFRRIAEKPNHLRFNETLPWLAKLATEFPEPTDIVGSIGKYSREQIRRFDSPQQRELYWQLSYLLGRYMYRERKFEQAAHLFAAVGSDSPHFVKSQFFLGISYVRLRRSVPALHAFQRIIDAIDEGTSDVDDEARMRDLANLSMARIYYSAALFLDRNNVAILDVKKVSAAVKYWNLVDLGGEYGLDATFELAWAYFMAGDYAHTLGAIHTLRSPYFPNALYPEADVLRMMVHFTTCRYDDTVVLMAKFNNRYEPVAKGAREFLQRFSGEGSDAALYEFLVGPRDGATQGVNAVEPLIANALADRAILRSIAYVSSLDEQLGRLRRAPATFRQSPVGAQVEEGLDLARADAVRRVAAIARQTVREGLDEINVQSHVVGKIVSVALPSHPIYLDDPGPVQPADYFGSARADAEHVVWPFDGEYWLDELGSYRQVVDSQCGKK